jgi:hypothetical protein
MFNHCYFLTDLTRTQRDVKVKITLEQATKTQRGSRGTTRCGWGGQHQAPAALPPGKRPGTHCIGGWVGPRAGLDGCGKSRPHRDSIPGPSTPEPVAIPTELSRPTHNGMYNSKMRNQRQWAVCKVSPRVAIFGDVILLCLQSTVLLGEGEEIETFSTQRRSN